MSDWALGKKLNSRIADIPLNHLIWLQDYKTYGEESYVFKDKDILHELYTSPIAVNDLALYEEAWKWLAENMNGQLKPIFRSFIPFKGHENLAPDRIEDILTSTIGMEGIIESIFTLGYEKIFNISDVYKRLLNEETAKDGLLALYCNLSNASIAIINNNNYALTATNTAILFLEETVNVSFSPLTEHIENFEEKVFLLHVVYSGSTKLIRNSDNLFYNSKGAEVTAFPRNNDKPMVLIDEIINQSKPADLRQRTMFMCLDKCVFASAAIDTWSGASNPVVSNSGLKGYYLN